jgi:valine--pyruvate aminotransferase
MEDLGTALTLHPDMRMLGGGQPAAIPEVQALWRQRIAHLLQDGAALDKMLLNYDPPGGNPLFREAFAHFLHRECGWNVTAANIGVVSGSQMGMFLLFNYLADGGKRILFPLLPDYIGYANQGLRPGMMAGLPGNIQRLSSHEFKYRIDFDQLRITPDIAALALSCPTNPTGNVITQDEFTQLKNLAQHAGIPLILDCAYGHPFPNVVHTSFTPTWEPGLIFSISLSKIGLPGVRTAVMVADPHIITALGNINAITSLANGNVGQTLLLPLLADNTLPRLCQETVRPFYKQRSDLAAQILTQELGERTDWALHSREGAFFLWLWLKNLRCPAQELYQRLKERKVLVIPGHHFTFGQEHPWQQPGHCLRITCSQPPEVLREGLQVIADEAVRCSGE